MKTQKNDRTRSLLKMELPELFKDMNIVFALFMNKTISVMRNVKTYFATKGGNGVNYMGLFLETLSSLQKITE